MDNLPDSLFQTICQILDKGDKLRASEKYADAIAFYQSAIDILPEPKSDWDMFTTLVISIGDTYYKTQSIYDCGWLLRYCLKRWKWIEQSLRMVC